MNSLRESTAQLYHMTFWYIYKCLKLWSKLILKLFYNRRYVVVYSLILHPSSDWNKSIRPIRSDQITSDQCVLRIWWSRRLHTYTHVHTHWPTPSSGMQLIAKVTLIRKGKGQEKKENGGNENDSDWRSVFSLRFLNYKAINLSTIFFLTQLN